ncbi:putative aspartic protease [Acorus calamus]|uniref:Aspartic protease n=1 Tax=Acorus calamus TaxID=4465 RepID=A0AAV9CA39_ACOCL|nr:putative aspartic protease [Acorus calamus]
MHGKPNKTNNGNPTPNHNTTPLPHPPLNLFTSKPHPCTRLHHPPHPQRLPTLPPPQPLRTPSDRLFRAARHSISRSLATATSTIVPIGGTYLMKLTMGTPPVSSLTIFDTGSELIWNQCQPCLSCFNQTFPIFNPQSSSTYQGLSCSDQHCSDVPHDCGTPSNTCDYGYGYGGDSFTKGQLSTETFTFDGGYQVPSIAFGCGHNNSGFPDKATGLLGLSRGPLSLINQLGPLVNYRFSHCLTPFNFHDPPFVNSTVTFGDNAVLSASNAAKLALPSGEKTFYLLSLESVTVENKIVSVGKAVNDTATDDGVMVVDSGSMFTLLRPRVIDQVLAAVKSAVSENPVKDPNNFYELCYGVNAKVPDVVLRFDGPAEVRLGRESAYVKPYDDKICLAILRSQDIQLLGSLAQQNFHVGFDVRANTISFTPADCTKQ